MWPQRRKSFACSLDTACSPVPCHVLGTFPLCRIQIQTLAVVIRKFIFLIISPKGLLLDPNPPDQGKDLQSRGASALHSCAQRGESVASWHKFFSGLTLDTVNRTGGLCFPHLSAWVVLTTRFCAEPSWLHPDSWHLGRAGGTKWCSQEVTLWDFCQLSVIHGAWSVSWSFTCPVTGLQRH